MRRIAPDDATAAGHDVEAPNAVTNPRTPPAHTRRGSERSLRQSGSLGRLRSTTSLLLSPTNRLLHHRLAQERASGKIQAAELAAVQHELKVRPQLAPPGRLSLQAKPYGLGSHRTAERCASAGC